MKYWSKSKHLSLLPAEPMRVVWRHTSEMPCGRRWDQYTGCTGGYQGESGRPGHTGLKIKNKMLFKMYQIVEAMSSEQQQFKGPEHKEDIKIFFVLLAKCAEWAPQTVGLLVLFLIPKACLKLPDTMALCPQRTHKAWLSGCFSSSLRQKRWCRWCLEVIVSW